MRNLADLGWRLAWFDQLARAVVGISLILGASLGVWPAWATALAGALGGVLVFEALIQFCPLARIWPWNR
jgi:hypothetical protein